MAEQAALDLNVQLEKLATTDALTGLANRRRFDDALEREWRRAVRNQLPLSLLVLDADYFKGYNDRYGHQRGDEIDDIEEMHAMLARPPQRRDQHRAGAAGDDGRVSIELTDGSRRDAKVVGKDSSYDLAVLKVDPTDLDPLDIGRSGDVAVGDEVVAVGSPLGLGSTVTAGIVSALERPVTAGEAGDESFISAVQTDAAINPGNSGGPLLNGDGDVIGVNTAIAQVPGQQQASGSIGVGFAIPSDVVVRTVDQLIATGKAEHPMIGVSLDRRWTNEGAKVLEDSEADSGDAVVPGGPADDAGVEPGDVITQLDGRRVTDVDQLITRIRAKAVGDKVTLTVRRDGKEQELTMTLEAAKES